MSLLNFSPVSTMLEMYVQHVCADFTSTQILLHSEEQCIFFFQSNN